MKIYDSPSTMMYVAWLCGEKDQKGMLEKGKIADLVILVKPPL